MKVSIIMPAYNAEKVCVRAIGSVLAQNYTDFELLIIDDGSSDDTYKVCLEHAVKDSRIKLYHQDNQGVSAARNAGLRNAEGEYIAFLDADDYYDENYLQKMMEQIEAVDADFAVCGYNSIINKSVSGVWQPDVVLDKEDLYLDLFMKPTGLHTLWNKVVRKCLIQAEFKSGLSMGEDLEFICDYLPRISRFAIVQEPIYNYISDSEGSLTKRIGLIADSIFHDYAVKKKFVEAVQIDKGLLNDLLCGRIISVLMQCKSYGEFINIYKVIAGNKSLVDEVKKSNPQKMSNVIVRSFIVNKSKLLLYMWTVLKKRKGGHK